MSGDPNTPCKLLSVANEIEAGDLVTALAAYDIEAFTVGGFTSGFKAEAPGNVQILVRRSDLDRAKRPWPKFSKTKAMSIGPKSTSENPSSNRPKSRIAEAQPR